VSLVVYDLMGREVAVVDQGLRSGDTHTVRFDAAVLADGLYFYRLHAGGRTLTRSMLLMSTEP
jgi:hypothetical protein